MSKIWMGGSLYFYMTGYFTHHSSALLCECALDDIIYVETNVSLIFCNVGNKRLPANHPNLPLICPHAVSCSCPTLATHLEPQFCQTLEIFCTLHFHLSGFRAVFIFITPAIFSKHLKSVFEIINAADSLHEGEVRQTGKMEGHKIVKHFLVNFFCHKPGENSFFEENLSSRMPRRERHQGS